jgi:AhpD family alkylhydroperoxidase
LGTTFSNNLFPLHSLKKEISMPHDPKPRSEGFTFSKLAPEAYAALISLGKVVHASGLEHELLELVKMRSSQINGCAFCLQMHTTDARKLGISEERLQLLVVWREAPLFSPRERAALAYAEAVTRIADHGVPDDTWADLTALFSEKEVAHLTAAIALINSWNRISVSYRTPPQVKSAPPSA